MSNVCTDPASLPCRKHDPDLWFADDPTRLAFAQQLCGDCPVRAQCLAGALARREPCGVWGGQLVDRGRIIRKRSRSRQRNADRERQPAAAEVAGPEARPTGSDAAA